MDLEKQCSHIPMMEARTVTDFLDNIWQHLLSQFYFCELGFDSGLEDPLFPIFSKNI